MSENINETVEEVVEETVAEVEETTREVEETTAEVEETAPVATVLERDEADLALVRKKEIFDKITTGLLILLMCAPFAILLYIIIWFLNP